ncbi:WD repeat-containing protein [Acrasis kona]|uniref:WD repeat-containing protein n=1 Tax=Acrasis kona TaxID=1008807 RepID=A0AAW2ZIL6_9EUKA
MRGASISLQLQYNCNERSKSGHRFGINKICITRTGETIITAGRDGTIKLWNATSEEQELRCSLDNHIDWVNDMMLLRDDKTLISCSSDNTIMLWDIERHEHQTTMRAHVDYAKCLSMASKSQKSFASGGLDGCIYIWDVERLASTTPTNTYAPRLNGKAQKQSIYSIAMNAAGSVLASGSTDKYVRAFDTRSNACLFKLRGHQDNVRSVMMNDEGNILVSGSSDNTVKYWDLRQQRCLHTYYGHDDSVWTLSSLVEGEVDRFVSGGRDKNVVLVDVKKNEASTLLCTNQPVLSICLTPDESSLWISTTSNSISQWDLIEPADTRARRSSYSSSFTLPTGSSMMMKKKKNKQSVSSVASNHDDPSHQEDSQQPFVEAVPKKQIFGSPAIIETHILNNKTQVLARDDAGNVTLWDVTKGSLIKNYGIVDFREQIDNLFEMQAVQNWFAVQNKLGCLEIALECPQCFNAEVYARDAGFESASSEDTSKLCARHDCLFAIVNFGTCLLRSIFLDWISKHHQRAKQQQKTRTTDTDESTLSSDSSDDDDDDDRHVVNQEQGFKFNVDASVQVVIHYEKSQDARLLPIKKSIHDLDQVSPVRDVPGWLYDAVRTGKAPEQKVDPNIIGFYLESCDPKLCNLPSQSRRLLTRRLMRIKNIAAHVIKAGNIQLPSRAEFEKQRLEYEKKKNATAKHVETKEGDVAPEEYLEILCNDRVLDPLHNLGIANVFYRDPNSSVTKMNYRRRYPV